MYLGSGVMKRGKCLKSQRSCYCHHKCWCIQPSTGNLACDASHTALGLLQLAIVQSMVLVQLQSVWSGPCRRSVTATPVSRTNWAGCWQTICIVGRYWVYRENVNMSTLPQDRGWIREADWVSVENTDEYGAEILPGGKRGSGMRIWSNSISCLFVRS